MLIFAHEIFAPILGVILLSPIVLAIAARIAAVVMRRTSGPRPWWGLTIGLLAVLSGAGMALMFLTTGGGVPSGLYILPALPILAGTSCLLAWNRKPRS